MGALEIVISIYSTIIAIILVFVPLSISKYNKTLKEVSSKITSNETTRRNDFNSLDRKITDNETARRNDFNSLNERIDSVYNQIIDTKSYGKNNVKSLLAILYRFNRMIAILKSRNIEEDIEEDLNFVASEALDLTLKLENENENQKESHNEE